MRNEQIIAAVARRMVIAMVREIEAVALFVFGKHKRLHSLSWANLLTGSSQSGSTSPGTASGNMPELDPRLLGDTCVALMPVLVTSGSDQPSPRTRQAYAYLRQGQLTRTSCPAGITSIG